MKKGKQREFFIRRIKEIDAELAILADDIAETFDLDKISRRNAIMVDRSSLKKQLANLKAGRPILGCGKEFIHTIIK